ncbi:hypothetical protein [Blastococcus sp. SYSU DS1024]
MDVPLLIDRLDTFASKIHQYLAHEGSEQEISDALDYLVMAAPVVEAILDHLGQEYLAQNIDDSWAQSGRAFVHLRGPCLRGIGHLQDLEIIESLKPKGSELSATSLHPWVWGAAASLWGLREGASAGISVVVTGDRALGTGRLSSLTDSRLVEALMSRATGWRTSPTRSPSLTSYP